MTATAVEAPSARPALPTAQLADEQTGAAEVLATARLAQKKWSAMPVERRAEILGTLAASIGERAEEISGLIHEENGKPLTEAVGHEVLGSIQVVNHHCSVAAEVLAPEHLRLAMSPHRKPVVSRHPYGVVLAIAPWNLPWIIPFSQVLPALLAGNAVVLKPSELTPRTGVLLGEVIDAVLRRAGLPPSLRRGLLQVVPGDGRVGAELLDARPDKVLFTGSVATGRKVMAAAARFPIPVALELGGVDAMIVRADADLEFASSAIVWGGTFNGGQSCCSVERLLVHDSIADRLRARVVDKLSRLNPRAELAPAIDERQFATWSRHLADAASRGLTLEPAPEPLPPRLMTPRLVSESTDSHRESAGDITTAAVWREETFGPVVAMRAFGHDDEAVGLHNASPFGLTASIISSDLPAAREMAQQLRAGLVSINDVAATMYGSPELPWGGVGESGFGRSHGTEGLLECSWPQMVEEPRLFTYGPKRPWWYPYDLEQAEGLAALARGLGGRDVRRRLAGVARSLPAVLAPLSRRPRL